MAKIIYFLVVILFTTVAAQNNNQNVGGKITQEDKCNPWLGYVSKKNVV